MNLLFKLVSFLFHPVFIPLAGSVLYFYISPRYFPEPIIKAKLLAVLIITVFIPIVFFFLLKNLGIVKTIYLKSVKERTYPLMLFILLIYFLVLRIIFDIVNFPALYFYFVGILFSGITCFILIFFRFKVSLHMVGISGLTMFVIALSIHFKINLLFLISFLVFAIGMVASARLKARAHNLTELVLGLFIGFLPQLITLKYWL